MVEFFKRWYCYLRFQRAKKRSEQINRKGGKSIVVNLGGKPCIIDRKRFRLLRLKGVFRPNVKWEQIKQMQIK